MNKQTKINSTDKFKEINDKEAGSVAGGGMMAQTSDSPIIFHKGKNEKGQIGEKCAIFDSGEQNKHQAQSLLDLWEKEYKY